jgi:ATP-dependent Zn protease
MTEAHGQARDILNGHRADLETVTRRLLEQEVMEGDELRRLLNLATGDVRESPENTPLPSGLQ